MHNLTLTQMRVSLSQKEISAQELTSHFINRIKKHDKTLNSFITLCEDSALAQAKQADDLRQAGKAGLYTGLPIAQKDIFCTEGILTTCGSKMLANFKSPYNASVVERFNAQGFVMLGKTNMDEFAMGSSNENSFFGPVKNPWNLECVPGGSSGGSAAAVAARLTPAATGTDTGGSIRQPAALCNITGIKPTYGRVSRWGMVAYASSLDQGGPMAINAEDAALMLNIMAGHDAKDSTSAQEPVVDYTQDLNKSIKGLRIGLVKEHFEGLDAKVRQKLDEACSVFKDLGAEFIDIQLPHNALSVPAYYVIAPAEASSNLARFDGVRYGFRADKPKDLLDLYQKSRAQGFGEEVKRRIMVGTYVLSAGYYDAYYLKAQKIRRLIREDYINAFKQVDVILGPTSPSPAFKIGEKSQDPVTMYLSDIYTIAVNLAGLPAISAPMGFIDGLPIGMQMVGSYFQEAKLLNAIHQYQQINKWHELLPSDFQ